MGAKLAKDCLDVGMVSADGPRALAFYRDLLGFTEDGEVPFPGLGVVKRLRCGQSLFRILVLEAPPPRFASAEAFTGETGLRYLTLTVTNLEEVVAAARAGGYPVPVPPRALRPGTTVAQITDGQGTWVELMQVEVG